MPDGPERSSRQRLEVEVKLKVRNLSRLRRLLLQLGCEETVPRHLEQNWTWDFPGQTLRKKGQLLRVRRFAGRCLLTFKGAVQRSRNFKIREERETEVQDPEPLVLILRRLGLEPTFCYEKFRTSYSLRLEGRHGMSLVVDETPIGNYLEIEGEEADIVRVARRLGFKKDAFITESYVGLFMKSRLRTQQTNMTFPEVMKRGSRRV